LVTPKTKKAPATANKTATILAWLNCSLRTSHDRIATRAGAVYMRVAACCTLVYAREVKKRASTTVTPQKPKPTKSANSRRLSDT